MVYTVARAEEALETPTEQQTDVADVVEEVLTEAQDVEVVEEEEPKKEITLSTPGTDYRFPVVNQSRHCYVAYCEAFRCAGEKGEEDAECQRLTRVYRSLCPMEWLAEWNEARENGNWWGKY